MEADTERTAHDFVATAVDPEPDGGPSPDGEVPAASARHGLSKMWSNLIWVTLGTVMALGGGLWQHLWPHAKVWDLPILIAIGGVAMLIIGGVGLKSREGRSSMPVEFSSKKAGAFVLDNAIILAMVGFVIVLCIMTPRFMQLDAVAGILTQSSTRMFMALGVSFSLIIAGTDLSAGRLLGVSSVVVASLIQKGSYPSKFWPGLGEWFILWPILIAIGICVLFGLLNGFLSAQFKMHPFIATLAVSVMAYGAVSLYFAKPPTNGQPLGELRSDFKIIGQKLLFEGPNWAWLNRVLGTQFSGLSILVVYAAAACVIIWFVLNKTTFGKNVYAVGGNPVAARVSGVNSYATIVMVFVIGAVMYALAGIMEAARTGGATNNYGAGWELDAIAACVVGGVSLAGGIGKVKGIIIGVLTFQIIAYGLVFIGANPYIQQIIKGIIIAVAVALDLAKYNRR